MKKTVQRSSEFELINKLSRLVPPAGGVIKGIGDDTAVLKSGPDKYLLFTTDMMAQGVHFKSSACPEGVGHKALACNISDIAAMGGVPTFAVVSLGLPKNCPDQYVESVYAGINRLARQFQVSIVGGDTIASRQFVINVALLGEVEKKRLVLRKGAKAGDWIWTTGPLGRAWQTDKHLSFTPRVKEARFLVSRFKPSAMIDISDGLAADLGHILEHNGLGARLVEDQIPRNPGADLRAALYDGEDFELIFTLHPDKAQALMEWQARQRRWFFYPVGEIIPKKGLSLYTTGQQIIPIPVKGFTHF